MVFRGHLPLPDSQRVAFGRPFFASSGRSNLTIARCLLMKPLRAGRGYAKLGQPATGRAPEAIGFWPLGGKPGYRRL